MDFETYMEKYQLEVPFGSQKYHALEKIWDAARMNSYNEQQASIKQLEAKVRESSDRILETALTYMEGAYQSKRARLKKQVTHFMGKFCIVKHENNMLRKLTNTQRAMVEAWKKNRKPTTIIYPVPKPDMTGKVTDDTALVGRKEEPERGFEYMIAGTHKHDMGAEGKCSYCGRYTLDPACLNYGFKCDCGKKNGFSGSFTTPNKESAWCGIKELV